MCANRGAQAEASGCQHEWRRAGLAARAVASRGGAEGSVGGGHGGSGRHGGSGGDHPPERGLLTPATASWQRDDLPRPRSVRGDVRAPVTVAQLEVAGLLGDRWEYLLPSELRAAERLRALGIELRSIRDTRLFQTPDAIILGNWETVEIKTQGEATFGAFRHHLRDARRQSRRLVIVLSNPAVSEADAVIWARRALGRYGGGYDEVLVLGDGFGILWP